MPRPIAALAAAGWLAAVLWTGLLTAQPEEERGVAPAAPEISLLTFAPGEIYWQRFGHNALLVRAPDTAALVYNYGIFDFQQQNFFLNFARGRMLYRLDVAPLDWTLRQYAAEGRWAVEQVLALDPVQAHALADFLAWNARPENADYRYDYFLANCSTKARDAIDLALTGALRTQLQVRAGDSSFRSAVLDLMAPMPGLRAGMDLGLGARVDAPLDQWQEAFIPMRLMASLRTASVGTGAQARPLVSSERLMVDAPTGSATTLPPSSLLPPFLLAGLAFAATLLLLQRQREHAAARIAQAVLIATYVGLAGLAGLVLLLGWVATEHWAMAENHNLLLLHPLWLLLLPVVLRRMRRQPRAAGPVLVWLCAGFAVAALLALMLALAGGQPNLHWMALLLPAHAAVLLVLRR